MKFITETMSSLVPVLAPLATLTVGLIAGLIAYQQWALARNKFKLDLFDRRYKVYLTTRLFLFEIVREGAAKNESLLTFMTNTADVIFLFDVEVAKYLVGIRDRAVELQGHNNDLNSVPDELKPQLAQDRMNKFKELKVALEGLDAAFYPYLSFAKRSPLKFQAELRKQGR